MKRERIEIGDIPALIWGEASDRVCLCVHGKMSCKEEAEGIARIACEKGYQTVSFDLPRHGERIDSLQRCDIWNGKRDLKLIADYVFTRWREARLYACSLGAFFSLHVYREYPFTKCLFQSPIVDMEHLIQKMMQWFEITEERLQREQEIDTPIDVLSWQYLQYIRENPTDRWSIPTCILFAGKDNLQSPKIMSDFAERFHCQLTVSKFSCHPFMEDDDIPVVEEWLRNNL